MEGKERKEGGRKKENQTTLRYHLMPVKMVVIKRTKKKKKKKYWRGYGQKEALVGGNVNWFISRICKELLQLNDKTNHLKTVQGFLKNIKHRIVI